MCYEYKPTIKKKRGYSETGEIIDGTISCHSLRKTFGYQAWKEGAEPALLMAVFNHSSYNITKRYLCIDQDDKDELFLKMNL